MKIKKNFLYFFIIGFLLFGAFIFAKDDPVQDKIMQMYNNYKSKSFKDILDISVSQLEKVKKPIVYVDIREKKEQDVSMIPEAITQEEFEKNLSKHKDKIIILYCTIGNRSGKYAKKLLDKNIAAYNLIGGILAWAWENKPLLDKAGSTKKVHVYGKRWNLLPDNYQGIW